MDGDSSYHRCLLDVMKVALMDIDLFSAEWKSKQEYSGGDKKDLVFPSYIVKREVRELFIFVKFALLLFEPKLECFCSCFWQDLSKTVQAFFKMIHFTITLVYIII